MEHGTEIFLYILFMSSMLVLGATLNNVSREQLFIKRPLPPFLKWRDAKVEEMKQEKESAELMIRTLEIEVEYLKKRYEKETGYIDF